MTAEHTEKLNENSHRCCRACVWPSTGLDLAVFPSSLASTILCSCTMLEGFYGIAFYQRVQPDSESTNITAVRKTTKWLFKHFNISHTKESHLQMQSWSFWCQHTVPLIPSLLLRDIDPKS